jgi:hypothetical protein
MRRPHEADAETFNETPRGGATSGISSRLGADAAMAGTMLVDSQLMQ